MPENHNTNRKHKQAAISKAQFAEKHAQTDSAVHDSTDEIFMGELIENNILQPPVDPDSQKPDSKQPISRAAEARESVSVSNQNTEEEIIWIDSDPVLDGDPEPLATHTSPASPEISLEEAAVEGTLIQESETETTSDWISDQPNLSSSTETILADRNPISSEIAGSIVKSDKLFEDDSSVAIDGEISTERSWPFRIVDFSVSVIGWCFGFASLIVGLAVIAVIPIVQILSLGYFLEVCGRIGKTGRVRDGFIGVRKASRVGSIVAGTWIMLLPIRYLSTLWYSSHLIDPASNQTNVLRVLQLVFTVLLIGHIVAAWYCGGRFRHFFWPIVAPFSIMVWVMRFIAATPPLRRILNQTVGAVSPRMVQDFCNVKPITDWFLPAILVKGLVTGNLFAKARDGLWDFVESLRLPYYFSLGFRGFVGSMAWLVIPALLLVGGTSLTGGIAVLSGFLGVLLMAIVIIYLPFAQAHFATEGKLSAMFDISGIRYSFVRAPMRFWFALLCLLTLAVPLFLFQIEKTYEELEWLESLFFMMLMLPARFLVGWAYARGRHREKKSIWPLTWSTRFAQLPLAFMFVGFLFVSRYTSMHGAWSIFDQPAFLIPAPFTEWPF